MKPPPTIIRARWVFPVDRSPLENGVIEIANGQIADVRKATSGTPLDDEADSLAVIPGLVNTHTHLEFSGLTAPLPAETTFAEWIRSIIVHRRSRGEYPVDALWAGLRESAAAGVTTIGEIATAGWTDAPFTPASPRAVAFREAISLNSELDAAMAATLGGHLAELRGHPSVTAGVSPHAPYSVHPKLFGALVELAQSSGVPLAVHLAETREELELLAHGTGPLVDLFTSAGFWKPDAIPRGTRPLDYLQQMQQLPQALVVHGNYLAAEECEFLAGRSNFTVVYCPRTHAHFRHEPHPWRALRGGGVRVALGTDSRASNPDLSLWNELLFLHEQFPEVAPAELLELGTSAGAEALGLDRRTGTISAGKSADLTVVQLAAGAAAADPHDHLLHPASRPIATMRDGLWISGNRA